MSITRVEQMRRSGMTVTSEYAIARRHLRALRNAKKMLASSTREWDRVFWTVEVSRQGIAAVFARDRARALRSALKESA